MSGTVRSATVIRTHGRHSWALDDAGERWQVFTKTRTAELAVGDRVRLAPSGDRQAWIVDIEPRRNLVYRSDAFKSKLFAANLDAVWLVVAAEPDYSPHLVARTVVACAAAGVELTVLLNKTDLLADIDPHVQALRDWLPAGTCILPVSIKTQGSAVREQLAPILRNRATLILGQSGMGKSTLLNLLVPDAQAATATLSAALHSGKHTTTFTQWYALADGGALIDSPGFQEFGLAHLSNTDLRAAFPDISGLAENCRFQDCRHDREPDCAVQTALQTGAQPVFRYRLFQDLQTQRAAHKKRFFT